MSIYTTPLQFGYFLSLLMVVLFGARAIKEERASDGWMAAIMLNLALSLQDYTFGFAGINFLWEELNGFPRGVSLLLGPLLYFYFKSQINVDFKFKKDHFYHLLPYLLFSSVDLFFFFQGPYAVQAYQSSTEFSVWAKVETVALWLSYFYYFRKLLLLYKSYRGWSETHYSDTEVIAFPWFRNFIYLMVSWTLLKEVTRLIEVFVELDYYQDWWWNLALVGVATYIGIFGYAQKQPNQLHFAIKTEEAEQPTTTNEIDSALLSRLNKAMDDEELFLQPELNLQQLAIHLKTSANLLSLTINQHFKMNFNDFVNSKRVELFKAKVAQGKHQQFTLLSLAYDCGFNSKATFNRAFKKSEGITPKEFSQITS